MVTAATVLQLSGGSSVLGCQLEVVQSGLYQLDGVIIH